MVWFYCSQKIEYNLRHKYQKLVKKEKNFSLSFA